MMNRLVGGMMVLSAAHKTSDAKRYRGLLMKAIATVTSLVLLLSLAALQSCKKGETATEPTEPVVKGTVILDTTILNNASVATVKVDKKISVSFPAGTVPNGTKMTIEEVALADAPQASNLNLHKVFNVTCSSGSQFSHSLDITINYDPAQVDFSNKLTVVGASFYNPGLNKWAAFQDVVVDKSNNRVSFKSNHLTTLSSWNRRYAYGYTDVFESAHFRIYWKSGDPMTNTQYVSPYAAQYTSPEPHYIQDLSRYLEDSYTAFKNKNLTVPTLTKVDVYIQDLGAGVCGNSSFFGYLNINKKMDAGASGKISDVLQQTAAHEFLHYVQDYYYILLFSDYTNKWWLEATATQADYMVWPSRTMFESDEYADGALQSQLDRSWDDCNSDPEFYIAGGFLAYLSHYRSGGTASIADLIIQGGNKLSVSNIRTNIDNYLTKNLSGSKGIGPEFADYIKWCYSQNGKIDIKVMPLLTSGNDAYVVPVQITSFGKQTVTTTIPYLAVKVVKIQHSASTSGYDVTISATNVPSDVANAYYTCSTKSVAGSHSNLRTGDGFTDYYSSTSYWHDFVLINTSKDTARQVVLTISASQPSACVAPGTLVTLLDGRKKRIEEMIPSEKIVAMDTVANAFVEATVEKVLEHNSAVYSITRMKFSNLQEIRITDNHPIYLKGKGWTTVELVKPGDIAYQYDAGTKEFEEVKVASIVRDESVSNVVYNLKTTKGNYIANNLLVHNKCVMKGTLIDTPDGSIPVETVRPGQKVYAFWHGHQVISPVTNVYRKSTVLPFIPGKRLRGAVYVTCNHLIFHAGSFIRADRLPTEDVRIHGEVYDIRTRAGSYLAGGILMKTGE